MLELREVKYFAPDFIVNNIYNNNNYHLWNT